MKKLLKIIIKLGLLVAFGLLCYSAGVTNGINSIPKTHDLELLAMANELKLDVSKLNLVYTDEMMKIDGSVGEYHSASDSIYIRKTIPSNMSPQTSENIKQTIAHEYMHHVWSKNGNGPFLSNDYINDEFVKLAANNQFIKDKAQTGIYTTDDGTKSLSNSEMFAYACTELSDESLADYPSILVMCNKYIDRNELPKELLH